MNAHVLFPLRTVQATILDGYEQALQSLVRKDEVFFLARVCTVKIDQFPDKLIHWGRLVYVQENFV